MGEAVYGKLLFPLKNKKLKLQLPIPNVIVNITYTHCTTGAHALGVFHNRHLSGLYCSSV